MSYPYSKLPETGVSRRVGTGGLVKPRLRELAKIIARYFIACKYALD
jgi:hypothetical protein